MSGQFLVTNRKELTEFERGKIIALSEKGQSVRKISNDLGYPKSTKIKSEYDKTKWKLRSGQYLGDIMYKYGLTLNTEDCVHLWILDLSEKPYG
nr:14154_t:CDS:2 [Entrophospora candida]